MELIDRRKLVSEFWQGVEDGDICSFSDTDDLMENAPTVDAVEVVHGEWVVCGDGDGVPFMCSHCGKTTAYQYKVMYGKYCPNCGAKMDLEKIAHQSQ